MSTIPYLQFPGTCRDALTFYASIFGTEIDMMMTADEMPDFTAPPGHEGQIAHASLKIAGDDLYASDTFADGSGTMAGCSIMVSMPSTSDCKAAFDALSDGGEITMPFQPTFWAGGFGTVTDRFGIRWMISSEEEAAND